MSKELEALKRLLPYLPEGDLLEDEVRTLAIALEQLEKHKQIEKALGIDLITLFKALKKGIWYKKNKEILYWENTFEKPIKLQVDFENYNDTLIECMELTKDLVYTAILVEDFFLKDYGKTWALTNEELEK